MNHFTGGIDDDRVYGVVDNFVKCRWQRRMVNSFPKDVCVRVVYIFAGYRLNATLLHTYHCIVHIALESHARQRDIPNEKYTFSSSNVPLSRCRYYHLFQCLHFSKILMLLSARLTIGQRKRSSWKSSRELSFARFPDTGESKPSGCNQTASCTLHTIEKKNSKRKKRSKLCTKIGFFVYII